MDAAVGAVRKRWMPISCRGISATNGRRFMDIVRGSVLVVLIPRDGMLSMRAFLLRSFSLLGLCFCSSLLMNDYCFFAYFLFPLVSNDFPGPCNW